MIRASLDCEVVVRPFGPHREPVVLEPMTRGRLTIVLADVAQRAKPLGIMCHLYFGSAHQSPLPLPEPSVVLTILLAVRAYRNFLDSA
jgi:hypothetical protein